MCTAQVPGLPPPQAFAADGPGAFKQAQAALGAFKAGKAPATAAKPAPLPSIMGEALGGSFAPLGG